MDMVLEGFYLFCVCSFSRGADVRATVSANTHQYAFPGQRQELAGGVFD